MATLLDQLKAHDHCGLDCFECDRYDGEKCGIGKSSKSRKEVFAEAVIEYMVHELVVGTGPALRLTWRDRRIEIEEAALWLRDQEGK